MCAYFPGIVKSFIVRDNLAVVGKKMDNFWKMKPTQEEDIFMFITRVKALASEVAALGAANKKPQIQIPDSSLC